MTVHCERTDRPRIPAVLLSDAAVRLMRDVFRQPSLLATSPRIERRVVAWGGDPVAVPHGAVVASEDEILDALPMSGGDLPSAPDFILHAAPSAMLPPQERFGARVAVAAEARLSPDADRASCWIEALDAGWLFLVPGTDSAWLLGVGDSIEGLLSRSRVISNRTVDVHQRSRQFDACPRIASSLHGGNWLLCGSAAIAFDPICGDGVAQAVREAILASAVIVGIAEGGDAGQLMSHYDSILTASMRRHLKLCAEFYQQGGDGPWWDAELAALVEGYEWCGSRLERAAEPRYRLSGFRLIARES